MKNTVSLFSTVSLIVVLFFFTGCRPADDGTVRLQLNWFPDAQHGGYYAADVHGHFKAAGLEHVEILTGGPGSPVIPKLLLGQVDFAIANADQVLMARDQENTDIVALFAPLQNSPRCIMVHQDSGFESLNDLSDVTLAMGEGKGFAEYLKANVALENVRIVPYAGTVAKFLVDRDYAQQGYVFTEPIVARRSGGDPRALMVSTLGFNPYTSVLLTRRELLQSEPELVQKFVNAVCDGWKQYLQDCTQTNTKILQDNSELDREILEEAAQIIGDLCLPDGLPAGQVGVMKAERWNTLAQQLNSLGLIKGATAENAFVNVSAP